MSDLNALIAQGAQFKAPPDPFAQYAQMQQLEQGQRANALAQMQMDKYQADNQRFNALRSGPAPEGVNAQLWAQDPKMAMEYAKEQAAARKESALTKESEEKTRTSQMKALGSGLMVALKDPSDTGLGTAFSMLDTQGIDTSKLRAHFAQVTDPVERKKIINGYVTGTEEGRKALEFVSPKAKEVRLGDKVVLLDENPNSPTFKQVLSSNAINLSEYEKKQLNLRQQELGIQQQRLTQEGQSVTYQTDAQGNVVALPSKLTLGAVPTARAVIAPGGGMTPMKGKLSATAEKAAVLRQQMTQDLTSAITELENATKSGGLIEQSTGSGAGALYDAGAGFFGKSTVGAEAAGALAPIYDKALKMVPRFEGPQSDKDTASYNKAAGDFANPAIPKERKLAAAKEVLRLMKTRKEQFVSRDMVNAGESPSPAGPNIDALLEKYK